MSVAAGVPDELFWRSTKEEVGALLREIGERRKADHEALRFNAGIIAAAVYNNNANRKRSNRTIRASEFMPPKPRKVDHSEFYAMMSGWAKSHNATVKDKRGPAA